MQCNKSPRRGFSAWPKPYKWARFPQGVAPDRVDLLPLAPATGDHLATYGDMDISLDPWPYAGTTTTCESLFMGARQAGLGPSLVFSKLVVSRPAGLWLAIYRPRLAIFPGNLRLPSSPTHEFRDPNPGNQIRSRSGFAHRATSLVPASLSGCFATNQSSRFYMKAFCGTNFGLVKAGL